MTFDELKDVSCGTKLIGGRGEVRLFVGFLPNKKRVAATQVNNDFFVISCSEPEIKDWHFEKKVKKLYAYVENIYGPKKISWYSEKLKCPEMGQLKRDPDYDRIQNET